MPYVVDTNVLLRAAGALDPSSAEAGRAIRELLRRDGQVFVLAQNLVELWNVCTRPAKLNGLGMTPTEAARLVSRIEATLTLLADSPLIYPAWRKLVETHNVSGRQVHDAHIAAAIKVHGVNEILTYNTPDFARYDGIRAIHPAEVTA